MSLGVDGSTWASVDVPTPCAAWMVPLVPDENTRPCLHYNTKTTHVTWEGKELVVEYAVLSAKPYDGSTPPLCYVKSIGNKKFAILKRGLVPLDSSTHRLFCRDKGHKAFKLRLSLYLKSIISVHVSILI